MEERTIAELQYQFPETLIEVAWESQYLRDEGMINLDLDSWDEKVSVWEIAQEFQKRYAGYDWDDKGEYYFSARKFAEHELIKRFGGYEKEGE